MKFQAKMVCGVEDTGALESRPEGTGNCFFIEINRQLRQLHVVRPESTHLSIRYQAVDLMRNNPELPNGAHFRDFIPDLSTWISYIDAMYQDGTWADHMVIQATAMRYNVNIHIISSRGPTYDVTIFPGPNHHGPTLHIRHDFDMHFYS